MRPAMSVVSLLLLFLLVNTTKGIRLMQHSSESIQREADVRGSLEEEAEVCREGEACPGWNNRKVLMIKGREAMASTQEITSMKVIKDSAAQTSPESYPDIYDIAGMDYSPAKKKSPIHN
ncbi:uncharacterized protein LOC110023499 [Phalaenopsis equestris]|uniref:uncharacterized protein LOC110023499 n=1 Tax=Phalaenopsis equestris TaxID=78828 RepID=UPI0009E5726A|nr:uncharacterized protein LOC110023499 [Phalaenopsis equestris]